jgi:DNA adenine methylase
MNYPGAKASAGVWQRIIGQMPPHEVYCELFLGSGIVFRMKKRARINLLVDTNASCLTPFYGQATCQHWDAIEYLEDSNFSSHAVIYCDPPYLLSTRQMRLYYGPHEPEVNEPQWHERLLSILKALRCHVLLSGYPSELYGRALQDWRCISYKVMTRGSLKTECLWCNFPEPTELHDWRYAGRNHRQRTSLKRLVARWQAKLNAMPALKRGYLLHNLKLPAGTPETARPAETGL